MEAGATDLAKLRASAGENARRAITASAAFQARALAQKDALRVIAEKDDALILPIPYAGDPGSMMNAKMNAAIEISWKRAWLWLERNKPSVDRQIAYALFEACQQRTMKIIRDCTEHHLGTPSIEVDRLAREAKEIQVWIFPPEFTKPLSGQRLEDYASFLHMCDVPLWNAYMALAAAKRSRRGAAPQIPLSVVILAAEEQLKDPTRSWRKIAKG